MSEQHRELIRKCQVQFIQAIVDSQCLGSLIYKLISQNQNGDIGSILQDLLWLERGNYANEAEKVRVFLEILCARGHIAIDHFFKVIIDTKHARLISVLTSQMPPNRQTGNERTRYFQDNRYNQGHMITGGNFDNAIFNQQTHYDAPISNYSFENYNHGGVNVNGAIHGETVVQGDQYIYIHDTRQAPSTSSFIPSQPSTEDWQKKLEAVRLSLKKMYLTRFEKVHPFSLPFTFDIENTWVSLALKDDIKNSQATEDHAELLERAFKKAKMLIIEGDPATGKTSLMRRLAYEWAKGNRKLLHYDLVLYAEFREVCEKTFKSIADLVLGGLKEYLSIKDYENLKKLVNNEQFCKEYRILLLLDGYDESLLERQCSELSSYMKGKTIEKRLFFHIVITTRNGYLSNLRGREGRFVFAEVLGFTTDEQKEKYISNHFLSSETDNKHNIAAVNHLLANNENLNKLAETPLFLTFICLVHERIVDGTLLELYCNIIWWLIDRHQKNYPDRDIPALFGFQNDSGNKFEIIQDHYLHFPQLHRVAEMALHNLEKNVFGDSDYQQFNIQPIIEHVGLLRKEEKHDNVYSFVTSYFFPHRTIQEFLAAFYTFYSDDQTNPTIKNASMPTNSKLVTNKMNEFQKFLLRISLSDKIPMNMDKRKIYFESKTDLQIDFIFDAFNTSTGFNNQLLDRLISQCTNITNIELHGKTIMGKNQTLTMFGSISKINWSSTDAVFAPIQLTFRNYASLLSSTVQNCTFNTNSQLTFTNCPSLTTIKFAACNTKNCVLSFAKLPVFGTVEFGGCIFEVDSDLSFTACPSLITLLFNYCGFNTTNLSIATLSAIAAVLFKECTFEAICHLSIAAINTLKYDGCTFSASSQLSISNCPNLNNLKFTRCEMESSTIVNITILPAIETLTFKQCSFEANSQLSFDDMIKLHSLTFGDPGDEIGCTFSANSQLSFTNCPSLKNLTFIRCKMESSAIVGIATLPAIHTVQFDQCRIDLARWQSITDQISNSNVKYFKLTFGRDCMGNGKDFNAEFLIHLQQCNNIEQMEITIFNYTIRENDLLSFSNLIKLHSLTFDGYPGCTFEVSSQLSFRNCPSLKDLIFRNCEMKSCTIVGIATLPAIVSVEFSRCFTDMATWQSISDQISNSNVKSLHLSADFFVEETYLHHLQKCGRIQHIHVNDNGILNRYEESVTANLALTAQQLPALTNITISDPWGSRLDESDRLSERNRERIEKAGQQRNPYFSIKDVE